uniref:Spermatogenesis and oogenesis specific basic helix-loop-helix 1 n=1 Tax=Myotis myotis TaxID=51298 RepID=A0A7J7QYY5_MYOMY|nr:spermatogenesis and oogenesis specific basic helix-loop-helix 1 [Myotis myotis]
MASRGPQPSAGVPSVPIPRACGSPSPGARFPGTDPGGGSSPVQSPAGCLPRNVLSERERRKRISLSCERLRALLPRFDGRREDMASVLEMSVQFLRMAGTVLPSGEQQAVLGPSQEDWHKWQLALGSQTPADASDPGTGAPGTMDLRSGTLDPRPESLPGPEAAPSLASLLLAADLPAERRGSELPGPGWAPDRGDYPDCDAGHQVRARVWSGGRAVLAAECQSRVVAGAPRGQRQ